MLSTFTQRFWNRPRQTKTQTTRKGTLALERLEDRELMAAGVGALRAQLRMARMAARAARVPAMVSSFQTTPAPASGFAVVSNPGSDGIATYPRGPYSPESKVTLRMRPGAQRLAATNAFSFAPGGRGIATYPPGPYTPESKVTLGIAPMVPIQSNPAPTVTPVDGPGSHGIATYPPGPYSPQSKVTL